jgi:DNA-binding NarL/FixJ family response regulator
LLFAWPLVGASGSWPEAHLMARVAPMIGEQTIGTCLDATEVRDRISSLSQHCLLLTVDSIAADPGEALVKALAELPQPPAVILLLGCTLWLRPGRYPFGPVDGLLRTQSFGTGALIQALESLDSTQPDGDPSLVPIVDQFHGAETTDDVLTPGEQETLQELAKGLANRQISTRLVIAEGTVIVDIKSLMRKFSVNNRFRVMRPAMDLGFLPAQGA